MSLLKDKHIYSYSQLSSFDECPYGFYLQRIEKVPEQASNGFAERGTLIHDLLDQWAKGILTKDKMVSEYERRYADEIVTAFPRMMKDYAQKAYYQGIEFLEDFDEFKGYKVVSAEEKFTVDLPLTDGSVRPFTGIVDLILREEWTDKLVICDHKSKSEQAFKKAEKEMYRQQLLYAQYVNEQYGEWPVELMFHLFNAGGIKPKKSFELYEFRESLSWATDCIKKIEDYTVLDWLSCKEDSDFYCNELCSVRKYCPRGSERPKTKKEKEAEKAREAFENDVVKQPEEISEGPKEKTCENCGAPYVPGKRKCPQCKAWYKTRKG